MQVEPTLRARDPPWIDAENMSSMSHILVGGVANPWLGDLDFGSEFIRRSRLLAWPLDVVLLDLALAPHRILHELQDWKPSRVILVAAFPRGDAPGTVRISQAPSHQLDPEDIQARLGESAAGVIDWEHTILVTTYFGALPEETSLIEVEPGRLTFGSDLSAPVEAAIATVEQIVRDQIKVPVSAPPVSPTTGADSLPRWP